MGEVERRATRQRRAVSEIMGSHPDFISAQELHALLRGRGETIGLATVYRTLAVLVEDRQVDQIRRDDGEALYRLCSTDAHHHHLVCRACGRTVEIDPPAHDAWARDLALQHGFTDVTHTLEIFGVCAGCR